MTGVMHVPTLLFNIFTFYPVFLSIVKTSEANIHYNNLQEEEAKKLVRDAIRAGIVNDLGSGSNVDITVIKKGSVKQFRPYEVICKKSERLVLFLFCVKLPKFMFYCF